MPVKNNKAVILTGNRMDLELQHFARGTYPITYTDLRPLPVNRFFIVIQNPGGENCRIEDEKDSFVLKNMWIWV